MRRLGSGDSTDLFVMARVETVDNARAARGCSAASAYKMDVLLSWDMAPPDSLAAANGGKRQQSDEHDAEIRGKQIEISNGLLLHEVYLTHAFAVLVQMLTRSLHMSSWGEQSGALRSPAFWCTLPTSGHLHAFCQNDVLINGAKPMLTKGTQLPNAFLPSASELLSSGSSSALCHAPAPFSTLHCKSASLCPAPFAAGAAAAAFKPADIAAAAGFEYFLFSVEMWNNLFLPWTSSENVTVVADPPQLFFDHDSTLDSCHLFLRCSPDWVVVLARVQHLRQRVLLQARSALPDVCGLALQSIYASAPDCFLVYPGK